MSPVAIHMDAFGLDLSARVVSSTTVVASPAAASETIIASVTLPGDLAVMSGVQLVGWAAYTVGTNGVSGQLKIRQTSVAGTTKADSGAVTRTAANLAADTVMGVDASPGSQQIYKLTLTVASGSAASTVSAVMLLALAI